MTARPFSVLVVDDLQAIREGLCLRLALEPGFVVAGAADSGETAVTLARQLRPDVVLLDIVMPGMDGITTIVLLREALPSCVVIVLTLYDDPLTRRRAREAGAAVVVGKHEPVEVLLAAVHAAVARRSQQATG